MNIKALTLTHIARSKESKNFWNLLNLWKAQRRLPEEGFFSVLVYGPHKTFKSELISRFKLLWPQCTATEGVQTGTGRMLFTQESAGYSLIVHTRRLSRGLNNGLTVVWDVVEVEKNRFFDIEFEEVKVEWDGEPDTDIRPRQYDLMPIRPPLK